MGALGLCVVAYHMRQRPSISAPPPGSVGCGHRPSHDNAGSAGRDEDLDNSSAGPVGLKSLADDRAGPVHEAAIDADRQRSHGMAGRRRRREQIAAANWSILVNNLAGHTTTQGHWDHLAIG